MTYMIGRKPLNSRFLTSDMHIKIWRAEHCLAKDIQSTNQKVPTVTDRYFIANHLV